VAQLKEPVHFQVFVTPTCPYCPRAVRLAHQLALESDVIRGDMVEAIEFPHLSVKYQVQGVPRTVINETVHIEGAVPEPMLMARLNEAVG
jgi:glutaredoxin